MIEINSIKVNNKIPKIRFPEYYNEWKKTRLSSIANFSKGKNISKSDIDSEGSLECIRYGELYTGYGEKIDSIISKTNLSKDNLVLSKGNEVLIPASGETSIDIATASCVLKPGIALGGDINIITTKEDGLFLAYYLGSKKRFEIASLAQGNSVVHVYSNQLKGLNVFLPQLKEQQKIASFLSTVDKRIDLLEQKKAKLEEYKKGGMQKIFSQEIRFKPQFEDLNLAAGTVADLAADFPDWEKKKIGEILEIGSGKDYKHLKEGKVPVYGTGGLMCYVNDHIFEGETACIGRKGTIDKPYYLQGKLWTVDTLFYTHSYNKCHPKFIYYLFLTVTWQKYNEASGVPSLSKQTINNIPVQVPCIEEQKKIASFLTSIDNKIELVEKQIEGTKQFKKGLLQQMFV